MKFWSYLTMMSLLYFAFGCGSTKRIILGKQTSQILQKEITKIVQIRYLIYVPQDYETREKWPLMLFLHGMGERGDDIEKVKVHGPPQLVEKGEDFPFLILSPQCPDRQWWDTDEIVILIDEIVSEYRIDANRIYVTGLSMGGYGTWNLALKYPHKFAAIAPICGGGNPNDAHLIKHLPIWVFHGAKDQVVLLKESQDMVDALRKEGNEVLFTVYPEASHDSWTETYNNPQLYQWLLKQARSK
jgi:predicted peptidase